MTRSHPQLRRVPGKQDREKLPLELPQKFVFKNKIENGQGLTSLAKQIIHVIRDALNLKFVLGSRPNQNLQHKLQL